MFCTLHAVADLGVMHGGQASFPPFPPPLLLAPFSLPLEVGPLEVENHMIAARGSGGVLKLPQRVRQTYFGAF